jgi:hypothetical protein
MRGLGTQLAGIQRLLDKDKLYHPDMAKLHSYFACKENMSKRQREHVVQFISEVCEDYSLERTAWVAVNYFDRYLARCHVKKKNIEKVSLTCLLISSKFTERKSLGLDELCDLCDHRLHAWEFRDTEREILETLEWRIHVPTPHNYLSILIQVLPPFEPTTKDKIINHAEFCMDLSAYEFDFIRVPYVLVAAASLICAIQFVGKTKIERKIISELCSLCQIEQVMLHECAAQLRSTYTCFVGDSHPLVEVADAREATGITKLAEAGSSTGTAEFETPPPPDRNDAALEAGVVALPEPIQMADIHAEESMPAETIHKPVPKRGDLVVTAPPIQTQEQQGQALLAPVHVATDKRRDSPDSAMTPDHVLAGVVPPVRPVSPTLGKRPRSAMW